MVEQVVEHTVPCVSMFFVELVCVCVCVVRSGPAVFCFDKCKCKSEGKIAWTDHLRATEATDGIMEQLNKIMAQSLNLEHKSCATQTTQVEESVRQIPR